ncbi:MAG: DNRLRE domain-containing protein, partial [Candidatus Sungbacteria bacterium]|nr:DNRLRE domain-containing protein [Candidatus Sungbacteria bacterium]
MKTKSFFPKITALALILTLNAGGILTVGSTLAFFNDAETAGDSLFVAGILNFSLASDEWTPVDSAGALKSGDMITRHMSILAGDSIPFQYRIRTIKTSGDDAFCGALHMVASRGAVSLYDGVLMDFDLTPPVEIEGDGQDDWSFKMSMPTSAGSFVGKTCEFRFVVDGWQVEFPDGTGGFSDREALENILESDDTAREDGGQNISALEDSYGEQEHPDDTNGTAGDLRVKSQSGGKNKRAFVRFDFPFPDGTAIQSAALKMFMDDAPSASRTYAVARTLSPWTEASISWNNQPGTSSPMSASAVTGITDDQWLAWDVKDDASAFVAGTATNYGWTVFDAMESSATAREGKFSSSENSHQDKRPVLEVAFSAPPATTSHIVINEVYADVGDGRGSEGTNEWVELYNPTESAVDIKDWQVCDAASCDSFATTSSSIMLPSRGFAVVTAGTSTWQHWVLPEGAIRIVLGANIGGGLANPGDAVILKNASSAEIDAMSYGTDTSKLNPAVPVSGEGNSLARIVKGYDAEL